MNHKQKILMEQDILADILSDNIFADLTSYTQSYSLTIALPHRAFYRDSTVGYRTVHRHGDRIRKSGYSQQGRGLKAINFNQYSYDFR
jgi:hypothetical protein